MPLRSDHSHTLEQWGSVEGPFDYLWFEMEAWQPEKRNLREEESRGSQTVLRDKTQTCPGLSDIN